MKISKRTLFSLGTTLVCYFCIYFPLLFILPDQEKVHRKILSFGISLLLGGFMLFISKDENEGFIKQVIMTAWLVGAIGFIIGFVGPLIFMPGANQGPLLGIFVTGPLGFVVGLIGGGVFWKINKRKI